MNESIQKNLKDAMAFIGQAQNLAPNGSSLWKELGKLYEEVDSFHDCVSEYDENGEPT